MINIESVQGQHTNGLLLLPFSPWGTLGLAIIMIIDAIYHFKTDGFKFIIKEIFSIQSFLFYSQKLKK